MYVCNCNGITEREIEGAVALGCATLRDLQNDLGVANCCGKCAPDAKKVLRRCAHSCSGTGERAMMGGDD